MLPALRIAEAQITPIAGVGAVGTGAFSWMAFLADLTIYLQMFSAFISVLLGLYAFYRICKKDE